MKAPSEKHLEDWIVANPDYMANEIGVCDKVVARQVKLPAGICDLVTLSSMFGYSSVRAVEIKKDAVDSKTLAQCLRYMRDLGHIFFDSRYPYVDPDSNDFMRINYTPVGVCEVTLGVDREIGGTLIGYEVPDKNILIACEVVGIQVFTYDFDGVDYDFDLVLSHEPIARYETWRDFSHGAIGDAMRSVIKNRFQKEIEWKRERDGGLS